PERPRVGRRMDRHGDAVHRDRAAVVAQGAAAALDQRRLASAVVAEERQDLAVADVEIDPVEGRHRAVALRRAPHRERSCRGGGEGRAHACLPACATRKRVSRDPRRTSASTATRMTPPITTSWKNASTLWRLSAFRMTPIVRAPTRAF